MFKTMQKSAPALILCCLASWMSAVPAHAATIGVGTKATQSRAVTSRPIEKAATRRHNEFRYDRRRHGHRYRHRRHGYNYYHGGYWYSSPFWALSLPLIMGGAFAANNSRHVTWCDARYRSYDVRRDAFKGYDGYWHRCHSPYD